MRLDHEFTVPAPVEDVWQAVIDPERVAPCMPGATITKVEGDSFSGTVKVKLGPISLLYKGSGEFLEKDEAAHKVVIKASGKDARGGGTAAATVTLTLTERDGGTHGAVATDMAVTGKPAQFGRGLIAEVGGKILDKFAGNLADMLGTAAPEPEAEAEPVPETKPAPEKPQLKSIKPEAEAIDLFEYAGDSVLKRLAPVLLALAGLFAVVALIRAIRR
ncbi:SRPBCC family protein [Amycolatopsis sp. H20-H5]|uniref:SRPBCC family protein n=1 Tax=Amycolatopsis sp. H20-H5 TaxID=3046309 RepID=UPI002DBDE284|nr:SRPBCC family protein [Amycolatopsis sp. H20-H5]MEC3976290.1 SRPBCC family protein [Amycolatopsis sp. H20-H5]